jgi:hypothetical protein
MAAVRVAIPLAVLADEGSSLPGLPTFTRSTTDGGLTGDATGFYAAAREFIAAWGRMPRPLLGLLVLVVLAAAVAIVAAWRRGSVGRAWLVAAAFATLAIPAAIAIHWMKPSGAAVVGWPLLWAVPLAALRAAGVTLTKSLAWDVGVVLSLACVAGTVFAVGVLGRNATGRSSLGLLAAALWTLWPLLVGAIAGHGAWTNGQWEVDAGLHNYTEPLSTLLVTSAAALLLSFRPTATTLVIAGGALGFGTAVKVSNGLLAAAALLLVYARGRMREAFPYLAGVLPFVPIVAVYWPLSYPKLFDNHKSWPRDPFDPGHVVDAWTHSTIFDPHTLAVITPLAIVGAFAVRRPWALALVLAFCLINPIFYSFYANTADHPRFLYASLPELFVLTAAGIGALAAFATRSRLVRSPA